MHTIFDDMERITVGSNGVLEPNAVRIYTNRAIPYRLSFYLSKIRLSVKSKVSYRFHRIKIKSLTFKSI